MNKRQTRRECGSVVFSPKRKKLYRVCVTAQVTSLKDYSHYLTAIMLSDIACYLLMRYVSCLLFRVTLF